MLILWKRNFSSAKLYTSWFILRLGDPPKKPHLDRFKNFKHWLYVIMSRTSFRVNLHFIVCLNLKELIAWSRCHIWSLSDSNGIQTHNHLVCKLILNHLAKLAGLAKWLSVGLQTKWLWIWILLLSLQAF